MTQASGEKSTDKSSTVQKRVSMNLAGSKLRKQLSSSLQEHVSAPTSDFAVKQLAKMGWTEGTGLGKRQNGIKTHIKVVRRQESAGLGTEKEAAEARAATESWWKDSLNDTLAKLSSKGKKKKKEKRKRKDYTDDELFEATGGARFGMRAGKTRNLAKWRRTESELDDSAKSSGDKDKYSSTENADTSNELSGKNEKKKKKRKKSNEERESVNENEISKKEKKKKSRKDKDKKAKKKKKKSVESEGASCD